jgi:hypothetical protein
MHDLLDEVVIDNEHGWGQVPLNMNVDYHGLRVLMQPSVFLALAHGLDRDASPKVVDHIRTGGSIGAPFLEIMIPDTWPLDIERWEGEEPEHVSFAVPARVVGHEGRNRMKAVEQLEGDGPIEVHLFFRNHIRRRHLTPEAISELNRQLVPEKRSIPVPGPFFKVC